MIGTTFRSNASVQHALLAVAMATPMATSAAQPAFGLPTARAETDLRLSLAGRALVPPENALTTTLLRSHSTDLRLRLKEPPAADSELDLQPEDPGTGPEDEYTPEYAEDLAITLANPVASLISVPFQFNLDTGLGPKDAERLTLNIQPVIPFSISEDWNLITRTIIPVIYQGSPADGIDSEFGLGDVVQSFFFSPKKPVNGWILAAGPVALWPTGTEPALRSEQLGLGPTALALRQENGWTYGMLTNHIWGLTDSDDRPDVDVTLLQPFVSYTWPTATTLSLNTESFYNWTGEQWTVPVNLVISQIIRLGDQPVQISLGGRYYAESPIDGQEWGIRFGFTFLFPR